MGEKEERERERERERDRESERERETGRALTPQDLSRVSQAPSFHPQVGLPLACKTFL